MTFEQIFTGLKNKDYKPVYFLSGDEPYYIDLITKYIMDNALTEAERSFNQTVFYGKDTDIATIINAAKRYPMMASYQVVIVKEAQHIRNVDDLIYYVKSPLQSTILVINYKYKKLDKRKSLYKTINEKGIFFESNKLYDNQLPDWITGYLSRKGIKIQPEATILLAEFLGSDLSKIVNELDKLVVIITGKSAVITTDTIERNIGISKEYNNFELQHALVKRDILKANRIISYFGQNQKNNPITVTITMLYSFFSKLLIYHSLKDKSKNAVAGVLKINPYFVSDYQLAARQYPLNKTIQAISLLREYDSKSKGMGSLSASPGELLTELVFKILH
jgi:DNA polymerase III subunit delta